MVACAGQGGRDIALHRLFTFKFKGVVLKLNVKTVSAYALEFTKYPAARGADTEIIAFRFAESIARPKSFQGLHVAHQILRGNGLKQRDNLWIDGGNEVTYGVDNRVAVAYELQFQGQ